MCDEAAACPFRDEPDLIATTGFSRETSSTTFMKARPSRISSM